MYRGQTKGGHQEKVAICKPKRGSDPELFIFRNVKATTNLVFRLDNLGSGTFLEH